MIIKYKGIKKGLLFILSLLFLVHGVLYLRYIDDIYNYDSPIKLIKYIIIIILLIVNMNFGYGKKFVFITVVFLGLAISHFFASGQFNELTVLVNYLFPMLIIVLYGSEMKFLDTKKLIKITYILNSIMAYYEYFFMDSPFKMFADTGYRVCSIFINPNNFAAFIWISTLLMVLSDITMIWKVIILGNSLVLMRLCGSRAGLAVMLLGIFLAVMNYLLKGFVDKIIINVKTLYKNICFLSMALIGASVVGVAYLSSRPSIFLNARRFSDIEFFSYRLAQINPFLENIKQNILFPNSSEMVYTDNLYFHIWGFFGFFVLIIFLFWTIYILYKSWIVDRRLFLVLFMFSIYGMSENFLYLWPQAYIYWYCVMEVMDRWHRKAYGIVINETYSNRFYYTLGNR